MLFNKQFITLIVGLSIAHSSLSQHQFTGWVTSNNRISLNRKISVLVEASLRSDKEWQHIQTFLLRSGLLWRLNDHWSVGAGYCRIDGRRLIENQFVHAIEQQAWQQVLFTHPVILGSGNRSRTTTLWYRLRMEHRFLPLPAADTGVEKHNKTAFTNRLRCYVRQHIPLSPKSETTEKGLYLALQNELFFNISGQQHVNGKIFDQNRTFLGLGYNIHKKTSVEIDYIHRYIAQGTRRYLHDHILQVISFIRL